LWYGGKEMARCLGCGIRGKNNKPLCWAKYQLCLQCCVKDHPDEYPENIVLKGKSSQMIKESERKINICTTCGNNIRKLAYHAHGKRNVIQAGYCTVCAKITSYDERLKIEVVQ
jgi:hypothetical protein